MKQKSISNYRAQSRGDPGLAKVMSIVALRLRAAHDKCLYSMRSDSSTRNQSISPKRGAGACFFCFLLYRKQVLYGCFALQPDLPFGMATIKPSYEQDLRITRITRILMTVGTRWMVASSISVPLSPDCISTEAVR